MSLYHGSTIPRDGLVLYIDSKNPKCWKGAPTTNVCLMDGQNGVNPWAGDGTGLVVGGNHPDIMFRGKKVVQLKLGSSGNLYLNSGTDLSTSLLSTQWTSTVYLRRLDGAPLPASIGSYMYITGNTNVSPTAAPTIVEDGWVKVNYTRTGLTSGYPTLIGCYGIGGGTDLLIANWQMEPLPYESRYVFGTRSSTESITDLTKTSSITPVNFLYEEDKFKFNGGSSYLDLSADLDVSQSTAGWTTEFWVSTPTPGTLMSLHSADADNFSANWLSIYQGKMAMWNYNPGYWKYGSTVFEANKMYQIVFVSDPGGTNMRFYVNGTPEGGDHVGNVWSPAYSNLKTRYIGQYRYAGASSRFFKGEMPLIKIYNRAFSDYEVLQNFESNRGRFGL